jgi:hypothetical protein
MENIPRLNNNEKTLYYDWGQFLLEKMGSVT